jgi:hypothetical protein
MTLDANDDQVRARFRASGTFFVPARKEFVVWGSITHGDLTAGMLLGLPLGNLVAYSPIGAVEAVEIDGEPYTAITIAPDDPEDLELWRCMKVGIGGEELPALDAGAIATE